ncbi:MAG: peptidoglycan-associated lipoprotein Pal [Deltaproteobacteria bacterium]|nr:MAG: peptidoglycan-associated lipoprotein Pal [Deltaproteobacteria bacterium]
MFNWKKLLGFFFIVTFLGLSSCASKKTTATDEDVTTEGMDESMSLELNGDSDSNTAGGLRTIYFDFDSAALRDDTRASLDENVSYLTENEDVEVQVEGHCDERGGVEYNLALGERRGKAVYDYLVAMGVDASRISTISYGKEKPVAFGHGEDAWSQNRRGNFVVTKK